VSSQEEIPFILICNRPDSTSFSLNFFVAIFRGGIYELYQLAIHLGTLTEGSEIICGKNIMLYSGAVERRVEASL